MSTIHRIGSNPNDDYSTLTAWYTDVCGDITNDGNAPYIAEVRGEVVQEPTAIAAMYLSTTDENHYFHIRPMDGAATHADLSDTSSMATVSGVFAIFDDYTRIENIRIIATAYQYPFVVGIAAQHVTADGVIVDCCRNFPGIDYTTKAFYIWASGNAYCTIKNCIVSDFYGDNSSGKNKDCYVTGIGTRDALTPELDYEAVPSIYDSGGIKYQDYIYIYNNTLWDLRSNARTGKSYSAVGIDFGSNVLLGNHIYVYNNVVSHVNGADASGFRFLDNINHDYNATDDSTLAVELNGYNAIDPSGEFVSLSSGVSYDGGAADGGVRRLDLWGVPNGSTDDEKWSMLIGTDDPDDTTMGGIDLSIDTTTSVALLGNALNLTYNSYSYPPRVDISGVVRSDFDGIPWDIGCWALDRDSLIESASGNYVQASVYELAQTLTDLETSASGVNAYIGQKTFDMYEKTMDDYFSKYETRVSSISTDVTKLEQEIVLLDQGIENHRH